MTMSIILLTGTFIFIIATVAPLIKRTEWWIRAFDFPYIQFTVFGLVLITGWWVWGPQDALHYIAIFISVGLIVYRLFIIYPYTYVKKPTVPTFKGSGSRKSIRIMSSNVLMHNRDYDGLKKLIEKENHNGKEIKGP